MREEYNQTSWEGHARRRLLCCLAVGAEAVRLHLRVDAGAGYSEALCRGGGIAIAPQRRQASRACQVHGIMRPPFRPDPRLQPTPRRAPAAYSDDGSRRPGDRITAYRLSMGSTLPGLGPLASVWRPALDQVLPEVEKLK